MHRQVWVVTGRPFLTMSGLSGLHERLTTATATANRSALFIGRIAIRRGYWQE